MSQAALDEQNPERQIKKYKTMKNQQKQEVMDKAKEIRANCYYMLDNAPQEMSNVSSILNVLTAVKYLISKLEEEDEED